MQDNILGGIGERTAVANRWRVEMLGGLRVTPICADGGANTRAGAVEQFRTHKAALLLARLALFPTRAHGREELADLFWPESSTERGRAHLTQSLVYLRQALGEPRTGGLFVSDHKTVRVTRGQLQTDVAEWEAAATRALSASSDDEQCGLLTLALSRYTGDLLPGFYADWVCDERNRLAALRDAVRERWQELQAAPTLVLDRRTAFGRSQPFEAETRTIAKAPLYLTRFFGRVAEIENACWLLRLEPPVRLLTLIGMGGIGKTRLALQIGQATLDGDKTGQAAGPFRWAALVPLAEARTAAQMEALMLDGLGVENSGTDGLGAIVRMLNGRAAQYSGRVLLILDNLEQLGMRRLLRWRASLPAYRR